jgi:retron-type reverse transcriptase
VWFFDELAHSAIMERVRTRIVDKRVLALIKAFLKAGIMSGDGTVREPDTGTPQGGLCSAEHNPPYEQRRVMRSTGRQGLVTAILGVDHCA